VRRKLFFMSDEKEQKVKKKLFDGLFGKLKRIKHLDIVLTILFIAIILLIYFSTFQKQSVENNCDNESNITTSFSTYCNELENKMKVTISAIKGVGNVNVMLYFNQGIETVIAYTTESKKSSDGSVTETKSPVLISNDGQTKTIVLQENMPLPSSVLIVASGAENTNVKLEILRAVQAMFDLSSSKIEVFAGN